MDALKRISFDGRVLKRELYARERHAVNQGD
jgi:hypothetical protein